VSDFAFEVKIVVVVRVRAAEESVARKVVPTVLGAPGAAVSDWRMRTMLYPAMTQS
jgi:hypothetical protein